MMLYQAPAANMGVYDWDYDQPDKDVRNVIGRDLIPHVFDCLESHA